MKKQVESKKLEAAASKHGGTNTGGSKKRPKHPLNLMKRTAAKTTPKTAQALTSLRQSGLNSLIGKIAKRASKTGIQIAAEGLTPDQEHAGRAFYSHGTTTVGGGGSASKTGSFKLGGVATKVSAAARTT